MKSLTQLHSAKSKLLSVFAAMLICLISGISVLAQDAEFKSSGKIWGYMFGDALWKVGGDTLKFGRGEYAREEKGTIGAKLRRVYFGYDYNISPQWSTRFLLEATATTITAGGNFGVVVKLGYLQFKNVFEILPNSTFRLGLVPTPVFAFPEKSWGYRSVEKEALDLRGFGNSVDQGASFESNFDAAKTSGFTVMIGNGSGNKPIIGKYLEYYASVHKRFFDNKLSVELMVDHKNDSLAKTVTRAFLSYEISWLRLGAEISPNFVKGTVKVGTEQRDITSKPFLISGFVSPKIFDNVWLFLRYDYLNPDTEYDPDYNYATDAQDYNEHLFIGGLQYEVNDNLRIIPNVYINAYNRKTEKVVDRTPDIVLRTTAYFIF